MTPHVLLQWQLLCVLVHWIMASNYGAQPLHHLDGFLWPSRHDTCQEAMYRLLVCDQLSIPSGLWEAEGTHHNPNLPGHTAPCVSTAALPTPWQAGGADRANQALVFSSTRPPRGNCSCSSASSPLLQRWCQQGGSSSTAWSTCPSMSGSSTTTSAGLNTEARADVMWWECFLPSWTWNGVAIVFRARLDWSRFFPALHQCLGLWHLLQ